jgi:hypothetical protein
MQIDNNPDFNHANTLVLGQTICNLQIVNCKPLINRAINQHFA